MLCSIVPVGVRVVEETLYAGQDRSYVVGRAPSVLKDIEAEFAVGIDIGVEHFGQELDDGWFVWVGFFERQRQAERPVLKGRFGC